MQVRKTAQHIDSSARVAVHGSQATGLAINDRKHMGNERWSDLDLLITTDTTADWYAF